MLRKYLILLLLLTLAVFVAYYFGLRGKQTGEVPTLEPEYNIHKKKPKDPGGIEIPNSDSLIYDQLRKRSHNTNAQDVKILPGPEKPLEIEFTRMAEIGEFNSIDDVLDNLEFYEQTLLHEDVVADEEEELDIVLPKDISEAKSGGEDESGQKDKFIDPVTSIAVSRSDQEIHKRRTDSGYDVLARGYYIQLTVAKSESEAKKMWSGIKAKQAKILSNSELVLKKLNGKNEKIFFLVMTGPYPNLSRAKLICGKLKNRGQHCIITK